MVDFSSLLTYVTPTPDDDADRVARQGASLRPCRPSWTERRTRAKGIPSFPKACVWAARAGEVTKCKHACLYAEGQPTRGPSPLHGREIYRPLTPLRSGSMTI